MKINFRPTIRQIIVGVISLLLFAGSLAVVSSLVETWCLTSLPGVATVACAGSGSQNGPDVSQSGTPVVGGTPMVLTPEAVAPQGDLPAAWDGASRVNVLIMGLDTQPAYDAAGNVVVSPDRVGAAHSDTMIVLTIDPQSKTAGMLSVPRDLWVNIPGYGYNRINNAYYLGEADKLPGGGPQLAMQTVEQVLGINIQYYAQVEFWAFAKFIDDIGKVNVYIPKKIIIDPMGPGSDKVMLSADWHLLNGARALAYVRNRHTADGDVDRSRRQQDVIFAIRDRILQPDNFPNLVANAGYLYHDIQGGINTNLTPEQVLSLAALAINVPKDNIKRAVIDDTMVTFATVTLGGQSAQILKPIPDKIRELRDQIFSSTGILSPMAKGADALALAKQEGATVRVLNGTFTQGLANKTSDYLKSLGINVVGTDTATTFPGYTVVIDHTGRPYMLKYLTTLFNLNAGTQIISRYDPAAPADIEIIVGDDWALKNTMP